MSAWKVQAARITLFPLVGSGSVPKSALDLYKAVWGKEPDSYQSQPSAPGFPFPTSVAQGVAGTFTRSCQTQPLRADFTFLPIATNNPSVLPSIEDTELLVNEIRAFIGGDVEATFQQSAINRVAVFLQLGQESSDYAQANEIISRTIWDGLKVTLSDEEDFLLQINRKQPDTAQASSKLNFITKWSVERLQIMTFTSSAPLVMEKIMPAITFDNSSNVALQKPFATGEIKPMLSQLFDSLPTQIKQCRISIEGF
jgi:hypothetical protein